MIRSILAIVILFLLTIFLPFWLQIVFYIFAVIFVKPKALLLIPALFADAYYSPIRNLLPANNKTFLWVLFIIVLYEIIIRNTRLSYVFSKK
jgi:hypothetical protein